MHVLNEMLEFCTVIELSLHVPRLPCHRHVGHPVSGITPHLLHVAHIRTLALLHRYLNELSDHRNVAVAPFLFRRRGTLFVPPW